MTKGTIEKDENIDVEAKLSNSDKSNAEIKKYVYASIAAGFLPTPLLDLTAVTGIQLKLVHSISKHYGKTFSKEIGKGVILSLIGYVSAHSFVTRGAASLIKVIPVVGSVLGGVALASVSGATTYAIGKIFIKHFEAGGTLLDFNAEKMKEHFKKLFDEGELVVSSTVEEVKKSKS